MADYTYMSLGGGVQSGTMAEMIVEGDLPKPDVVIFADTGDEPQDVYRYVEYLGTRLSSVGVKLRTVTAGNIVDDLASGKGRFAAIPAYTVDGNGKKGHLRRQCTNEYKIVPIERAVREEMLVSGLSYFDKRDYLRTRRGIKVEAWLGISLDEVARMKPSRKKWITNTWPLIQKKMTRNDCVNWLRNHDLPIPNKSSCRICPFHDNNYWRKLRDGNPADWQHVVDFDRSLRDERGRRFAGTATGTIYLHTSCIPLEDVDLRTAQERGQMNLFETEQDVCDEGYCFI